MLGGRLEGGGCGIGVLIWGLNMIKRLDVFGKLKRSIRKVVGFTHPTLAALLGFSSILGSCGSNSYILDIDKIVTSNIQGDKIFSITELTSVPVHRICSFGPYDDISFVTNSADSRALKDVDIFPVNEGDGYFVYFDTNGNVLGYDRFPVNMGPLRWGPQEKRTSNYCLSLPGVAIRTSRAGETIVLSITEQ